MASTGILYNTPGHACAQQDTYGDNVAHEISITLSKHEIWGQPKAARALLKTLELQAGAPGLVNW